MSCTLDTGRRVALSYGAVFAIALGARLAVIFRHGGLRGSYGYDSAVYFAAADALVHGRMPYRDFVLLHPPALMVVLTPFAALTRWTSDSTAFGTAAICFAALGALNAALVVAVGKRFGLGHGGALVAGGFYALWFGSVGAEYLARLEPLGNLFLLVALLLLARVRADRRMRTHVLAGCALGAMVSTKIWWSVPAVVLIVWYVRRERSLPRAGQLLLGIALALALLDVPFLVMAPRAMWSSVVTDQLGRQASHSPLPRLGDVSSLTAITHTPSHAVLVMVSVATALVAAALIRAAWRVVSVRPLIVLLVVQCVVVAASPSWFTFYADYLAVAAAVTVGAATTCLRSIGALTVAVAVVVTGATLVLGTSVVRPAPGASTLSRQITSVPCLMSDSPMGQIELDALTRGLEHNCRNWVDVTGRTYGPDHAPVPRVANKRWQHDLRAYLRSGQAVVVVRASGTGLDQTTWAAVRRDGVLRRAGRLTVYQVRSGHAAPQRSKRSS